MACNSYDSKVIRDLGLHASQEAVRTLFRIAETAPYHLQVSVLMLSMALTQEKIKDIALDFTQEEAEVFKYVQEQFKGEE